VTPGQLAAQGLAVVGWGAALADVDISCWQGISDLLR
jgi:hypothetical protein